MYLNESGDGRVSAMDLAIYHRANQMGSRLNPESRLVDPMVFTLLFPRGDAGYYIGIKFTNDTTTVLCIS